MNADARSDRLAAALARIDEANRADPNEAVDDDGRRVPKELLYALRMSAWLERLEPHATDALAIAVRAQHVCRWKLARDRYPMNRDGYRAWRTAAGAMHADIAAAIARDVGYDEATIARVSALVRKEKLKVDPDAQLLEDVACLVFLESYFSEFARKHDEDKLVAILRKTWKKMSERGRHEALGLPLAPEDRALVERAIAKISG